MRADRFLKLAGLLEADAINPTGIKFDLGDWAKMADKLSSIGSYDPSTTTEIPVDCGTAACAVGFAAICGAFKDEGLGWEISGSGALSPIFEDLGGWEAVDQFFEIVPDGTDTPLAYKLFDGDYYRPDERKGKEGELAVAKRIRQLVSDGHLDGVVRVS